MMKRKRYRLFVMGCIVISVLSVLSLSCRQDAEKEGSNGDHHEDGYHMDDDDHHHGSDEPMEDDHDGYHHSHEGMSHSGNTGKVHDGEHRELSGTVTEGVRVIEMKARRYEFDPSSITVNEGEHVLLTVTSEDVTHGINIDGYDINKDLPPQEVVEIEFTADKAGTHHFHCSVYCGEGHDRMHGTLYVKANPN